MSQEIEGESNDSHYPKDDDNEFLFMAQEKEMKDVKNHYRL